MTDFIVTVAGLNRQHKHTANSHMTLHVEGCRHVKRAKVAHQEYLNGWVLDADDRPVSSSYNSWVRRDDEFGIDSDLAYGQPQHWGEDAASRAARARLWIEEGKVTCGTCQPEAALAALQVGA